MRSKYRPLTVDGETFQIEVLPDGGLGATDPLGRPVAWAATRGALVAQIRRLRREESLDRSRNP